MWEGVGNVREMEDMGAVRGGKVWRARGILQYDGYVGVCVWVFGY